MDLAARTYDRGLILGRVRNYGYKKDSQYSHRRRRERGRRSGVARRPEPSFGQRPGHTITITDHGRPVARIVPVGAPTSLERLIADEVVTPARRRPKPLPPPVATAGSVSDLVEHQRR